MRDVTLKRLLKLGELTRLEGLVHVLLGEGLDRGRKKEDRRKKRERTVFLRENVIKKIYLALVV